MSNDKLTNEERLEIVALRARLEAEELRVKMLQLSLDTCMTRISQAHSIDKDVDRVNLDTGEIIRGGKKAKAAEVKGKGGKG